MAYERDRTCHVKNCLSLQPAVFQVVINAVSKGSGRVVATGETAALCCSSCKVTVKLQELFMEDAWVLVAAALSQAHLDGFDVSYERSFLTFKLIPQLMH